MVVRYSTATHTHPSGATRMQVSDLRTLYEYTNWANTRIFDTAEQATAEQFQAARRQAALHECLRVSPEPTRGADRDGWWMVGSSSPRSPRPRVTARTNLPSS